jgi:hypothetical protein
MVPMWMFPVALACGNTFVLKPSEKDPGCPMRLAELLREAELPDGVFNVVNGDREAVDTLLTDPRVAAVSFVGSTPIAEYIYRRERQRQAGAGARRRQEPHGRHARRRSRAGGRCADRRRLRLGRRALHGDLGRWSRSARVGEPLVPALARRVRCAEGRSGHRSGTWKWGLW